MECASLRLVLTQRTQAECFLRPDTMRVKEGEHHHAHEPVI